MGLYDYDDGDGGRGGRRFYDFECPSCDAHNPYDAGYTFGDEVICYSCGVQFKVRERSGKAKLEEA